jgi:hypothetical protein
LYLSPDESRGQYQVDIVVAKKQLLGSMLQLRFCSSRGLVLVLIP